MIVLHVPGLLSRKSKLEKATLWILFAKTRVVTLCDRPLPQLAALLPAGRTGGVPKHFHHGTTADIVAWILGALLDGVNEVMDGMLTSIETLETGLRRRKPNVVTRELGSLRRDALMLDLMVDPSSGVLTQFLDTRAPHRSRAANLQLAHVRDRLSGQHIILEHYSELIEGLFRMHESHTANRTNQVVLVLTIMSVLLMPPTLVASYYGMNVANLPFVHDYRLVTGIILASIVVFLFVVYRLRK